MDALTILVRRNDTEATRGLLESHPGLRSRLNDALPEGPFGATALLVAVHQGNREMVELLLEFGADINARYLVSRGCRTDILMASAVGDLPLVRKHLAVDPVSIHLSVTRKNFPMRDERAGGTIYNWTLGANRTPHTVARDVGHAEVFDFLMSHSPEPLQLAIACEVGDEALATRLLARTPGLAQQLTEPAQKRLPAAGMDNNLKAVRLMLAAGWPTNVRGKEGGTALHWAAFHGNAEMVREILRYKPDLTLRDGQYNGTALGWAEYGSENSSRRAEGDYPATIAQLSR
jgi:ankyrin repeat protein